MKLVISYFVESLDGEVLIRDGKPIGTAVWLAPGTEPQDIMNIGAVQERPMLLPEPGKVLRNKHTGEIADGGWLRDTVAEDWEEIDNPEEEENVD